ncbi:MAG: FliA/WhiG family RNA polymerase sigma factor, partial [Limisphaerales bacterium]
AGLVGLIQAIRNYDPSGGSSFENYAKARIRGAIIDELRRMDWVPRSIHSKARKVQEAINKVESAKGGVASEEEIARCLNISIEEYERLLSEIKPVTFICLDAVIEGEEGDSCSLHESIADKSVDPPDVDAQKREFVMLIARRIEQLPIIQRKVLAMYYFENMRLKEIAEAFGLTESRICQIHTQEILSIRAFLQRHGVIS